jgi:hypothetical protein
MKSIPRAHWQVHSEEKNITANSRPKSKPPQQFIIAETKFKAYSLSAGTFIDIVDDPSCCPSYAETAKRTSCLRIRTGARQIAPLKTVTPTDPPLPTAAQKKAEPAAPPRTSRYILPTDLCSPTHDPYAYTPVALWPASGGKGGVSCLPDPDARAHEALNPIDAHGVDVQAFCDDRLLVLLLRGGGGGEGRLVVLSFDSAALIPDDSKPVCRPRKRKFQEDEDTAVAVAVRLNGGPSRPAVDDAAVHDHVLAVESPQQKEPYLTDVLRAMARVPDEVLDDAVVTDLAFLDFESSEWGFASA